MTISKDHQKVAKKYLGRPGKTELRDITASMSAEGELLIGILETLSQSRHINEYLRQLVELVRKYSECHCVGIRLLDDDGNIPYVAYVGFSREFYEKESSLCIKSDRCMCINVIKGDTNPGLPFYTDGGSFISNGTAKLLTSVPKETIGENRGVCNQFGYESLALVPMRHKSINMGLIHLADKSENNVPIEKVRFLERVGTYIGETLRTFMAEEALEESEKRYRDLYEEAPSAYFLVGVDGYIRQANRSAAELLGYSLDELIGKQVLNLYADTPNGKAKAQEAFQRFLAGEEIRGDELEMCRADGSILWISLSVRPIRDKEGRVVDSRSTVVDITERKMLDQLKDEFIGMVSHELRTPLTVIMGSLRTVLSEGSRLHPSEIEQLLRDAVLETETLSHLLSNLVELSRYQAGQLTLYTEPVRIETIALSVVKKIKRQTSVHRFSLDFPGTLLPINADPLRLERILYNLLENAIKYSPEGGEIKVFAKMEEGYLVIGVTDHGIGISHLDQAKLFESFQQLDRARSHQGRGVGLGLLVCRRLVESHNGKIWVESESGAGSTFFFAIPL